MTDIPDTNTIKGPDRVWLDWPGANRGEVVYDEPPERDTQPGQIEYVRADLHAALAARVIEQDARIARLTEALRLHQAWSDSEDAGPDYGAQTRDTHPDGERIWRQWWDGNLDLCARAQEATRAALEDGQ